jgi:hypothetical protein
MWKHVVVGFAAVGCVIPEEPGDDEGTCGAQPDDAEVFPLKEAKLNIEHNATDLDTGFQGFIDSEGWSCLEVTDPYGDVVFTLLGGGALGELGLTELFFETVEPENKDVPIDEMLEVLPEGDYTIQGPAVEAGEVLGWTIGVAQLDHLIPNGPALVAPAEEATIPVADTLFDWEPVTTSIDGDPVTIVSYQLIVEQDMEPVANVIGHLGLSMVLPATTTEMLVSAGFFEAGVDYDWEVLAIDEGGNQTLSSGTFSTET